jgi:tetratricopeptide (TPR) repeat protein
MLGSPIFEASKFAKGWWKLASIQTVTDSPSQVYYSKFWRRLYVANLVFVLFLLVFMVIASLRPKRTAQDTSRVQVPDFVKDAPTLVGSTDDTFSQVTLLIQQGKIQQALPLLGSITRNSTDRSAQSKALLLAGVTLATMSEDEKRAIAALQYFDEQFKDQPGIDNAKYQLALLRASRGEFSQAQLQLSQLIRDYPQSPLISSASFLAARSAEYMVQNESSANGTAGKLVSTLLPPNSTALLGFVVSILITIVSTHLGHREKLQKGQPLTVLLVVCLIALSASSSVINVRSQSQQAQALASSASTERTK